MKIVSSPNDTGIAYKDDVCVEGSSSLLEVRGQL